tara:strand:- start:121 stop:654 length:534 start_codon:yes stop_codon:yes gene_type:complete
MVRNATFLNTPWWIEMTDKELYIKVKKLLAYKEGKLIRRSSIGRGVKGGEIRAVNSQGYIQTTINCKFYLVHRLVWLLHYREMAKFIDHINGDRQDNRIENLREVTPSQNAQNRALSANNTSGVKGVHWSRSANKWQATVMVNGIHNYLGVYVDIREAEKAVCDYRKNIHGDYANNG